MVSEPPVRSFVHWTRSLPVPGPLAKNRQKIEKIIGGMGSLVKGFAFFYKIESHSFESTFNIYGLSSGTLVALQCPIDANYCLGFSTILYLNEAYESEEARQIYDRYFTLTSIERFL